LGELYPTQQKGEGGRIEGGRWLMVADQKVVVDGQCVCVMNVRFPTFNVLLCYYTVCIEPLSPTHHFQKALACFASLTFT